MENTKVHYIVAMDSEKNIVFIGDQLKYIELSKELESFNADYNKSAHTKFLTTQMFGLKNLDNLKDDLYNIYVNWYRCYPIEAKIRSSYIKEVYI